MKTDLLDLSANNSIVDLEAVALAGVRGVVLKATEGVDYLDPRFLERVDQAKREALSLGCYHYLRVRHGAPQDARRQASQYLARWRTAGCDLRPIVDVETAYNTHDQHGALLPPELRATVAECTQAVVDFVDQVRQDTGMSPGIYTSAGEWVEMGLAPLTSLADCPLWIASYGSSYRVPAPWTKAVAWQWGADANKATCPGVVGFADCSQALDLDALLAPTS